MCVRAYVCVRFYLPSDKKLIASHYAPVGIGRCVRVRGVEIRAIKAPIVSSLDNGNRTFPHSHDAASIYSFQFFFPVIRNIFYK